MLYPPTRVSASQNQWRHNPHWGGPAPLLWLHAGWQPNISNDVANDLSPWCQDPGTWAGSTAERNVVTDRGRAWTLADGNLDYINLGDNLELFPRNQVTHVALLTITTVADRNRITSFGKTAEAVPYLSFGLRAPDTWRVVGSPNNTYREFNTGINVDTSRHLFAASYDSVAGLSVFLDGQLVGSDAVTWQGALGDASGWTPQANVGKESYKTYYTSANIAFVAVFADVLSVSQHQLLYESTLDGSPGVMAWPIGRMSFPAAVAGGNAMPMAIHHYQMAGAL